MKVLAIILVLFAIVIWRFWLSRRQHLGESNASDLISRWAVTGIIVAYYCFYILPSFKRGGRGTLFAMLDTVFFSMMLTLLWGRSVIDWLVSPLTGLFDGGGQRPEARPLFSVVEARRKQGRFAEAIAEVRQQLDRFPGDFDGQMLLADIQAEDLNDLPAAQATLEGLLGQQNHPPHKQAFALSTLADWHLKFGQDPDAARAALERIMQRFPDTELAQKASQRLVHLPTREDMRARKERPRIVLQRYDEYLKPGETLKQKLPAPEANPVAQAEACVRRLEEFPQDNEARETLALIYADHYRRLDLAVAQLEQLIAQPNAPTRHVVHWLTLMASLQLKLAGDRAAARLTYQRIADRFPQTPAAEEARRQIGHLGAG